MVLGFFSERLGVGYCSWWYVQHMLPYGTGNSLYAIVFVHFIPLFFLFFLSGIETPEQNWQWYQHPPALFAIFTEGTNFVIMLIIMFYGCKMCMFRLHSFYVGFDLVTSPELTVRLTGLYKSIHK